MRSILLFTLLLSLSLNLSATKIARVSIDDLLREADKVALVTVTRGERTTDPDACGVLYHAQVETALKNTQAKETIAFYNRFDAQSGLRIAQQFILFLNKLEDKAPCQAAALELAHAGYGALWVGSPYRVDIDEAVKIPKSFVQPPQQLPAKPGQSSNTEISETLWLNKADVLRYLQNLR